MQEKYTIILSDKVQQQFLQHVNFLAQKDISASQDLKKKLLKAFKSLENMPYRFPFFNEEYIPYNKYHKMFIEKYYLILYQVKDTTVFIDYILDCRQDYAWIIH